MEQVKQFLEQYNHTTLREERTALLVAYQSFLETLSADDRSLARQYMQSHLRPQVRETVKTLDALAEKAALILGQKGKIIYEGREYILGDWVTIADYCRLYNFKPARVQNWIDRELVPRQNVVTIQELNNLKLLKNVPYRL